MIILKRFLWCVGSPDDCTEAETVGCVHVAFPGFPYGNLHFKINYCRFVDVVGATHTSTKNIRILQNNPFLYKYIAYSFKKQLETFYLQKPKSVWRVKESRRAFEPRFDRHTQCVVNSSLSLFIHLVLVFTVLVLNRNLCLCTKTFVGNCFNLIFTVMLLRLLRSHIKCVQWFEPAQVGHRLVDRR